MNLKSALALHRNEPCTVLSFDLRVDHLIDSSHCSEVEKKIDELGGIWETRKATRSLWQQLPNVYGLYMFVWCPKLRMPTTDKHIDFKWILYVGEAGADSSSNTIKERYRAEYSRYVGGNAELLWQVEQPKNRSERLERFLILEPMEFWFLELTDTTRIKWMEKRLQRLLSPPLNRSFGPRITRTRQPEEAF